LAPAGVPYDKLNLLDATLLMPQLLEIINPEISGKGEQSSFAQDTHELLLIIPQEESAIRNFYANS
jgi:hypothetical protein